VLENSSNLGAASPLSASAVKNAILVACERPRTKAIVRLEIHVHLNGHGRGEERLGGRCRFGHADVDEDHVTSGKQLGRGPEHGVHRGDPRAGASEGDESRSQGALERADVEDEPGRRFRGHLGEDLRARPQRRRDHDHVVHEVEGSPVGRASIPLDIDGRIRHVDFESLGFEKRRHPATHLPRAADHERGATASPGTDLDAVTFLDGERGFDQLQEDAAGDLGREADLLCRLGGARQDGLLLAGSSRRSSGAS
jgi:hypothetical protein